MLNEFFRSSIIFDDVKKVR